MSFELGQRVRVLGGPGRGATGEVVGKGAWNYLRVRLDSGKERYVPDLDLIRLNDIEEGWIGGTDAEDDEAQEGRRESSE